MRGRLIEAIQATAVVVAVALVAASLPHLEGKSLEVQLWFAVVGAFASAVILFLVRATRSDGRLRGSFYVEPSKYRGLKIGFVGFCVAMLGWLVAVFIAGAIGYWLVVFGVLVGVIGMIIHVVLMFAPGGKRDA
jgi:hypothetical protein